MKAPSSKTHSTRETDVADDALATSQRMRVMSVGVKATEETLKDRSKETSLLGAVALLPPSDDIATTTPAATAAQMMTAHAAPTFEETTRDGAFGPDCSFVFSTETELDFRGSRRTSLGPATLKATIVVSSGQRDVGKAASCSKFGRRRG